MNSIGFIAASHRRAAASLLPAAVTRWAKVWCLGGSIAEGTFSVCKGRDLKEGSLCAGKGGTCLYVVADDHAWKAAVFGAVTRHIPDDAVAAALVGAARQALFTSLAAVLGLDGDAVLVSAGSVGARTELLRYSTSVNGADIVIFLSPAVLAGHAFPERRLAAVPLTRRSELLGTARVGVRVELPVLSAPARELMGLRPGDVVCGTRPLDASFHVYVGDGKLPLEAALGSREGKRAVKLRMQTETKEEKSHVARG